MCGTTSETYRPTRSNIAASATRMIDAQLVQLDDDCQMQRRMA